MKVDLLTLRYRMAMDIVKFCIDNNIEQEKCAKMMSKVPLKEVDWVIELSEEDFAYFKLKWS